MPTRRPNRASVSAAGEHASAPGSHSAQSIESGDSTSEAETALSAE
jgi:hypothetical protein